VPLVAGNVTVVASGPFRLAYPLRLTLFLTGLMTRTVPTPLAEDVSVVALSFLLVDTFSFTITPCTDLSPRLASPSTALLLV
jgi:hypothetical protein